MELTAILLSLIFYGVLGKFWTAERINLSQESVVYRADSIVRETVRFPLDQEILKAGKRQIQIHSGANLMW